MREQGHLQTSRRRRHVPATADTPVGASGAATLVGELVAALGVMVALTGVAVVVGVLEGVIEVEGVIEGVIEAEGVTDSDVGERVGEGVPCVSLPPV